MWNHFVDRPFAVACTALSLFSASTHAAPPTQPLRQQVIPSKIIWDNARANISQRLIVTLKADDVNANVRSKREAQGLQIDSESHQEEKRRAYSAVREKVFPRGRLGNSIVRHSFEIAPTALVEVPNDEALRQILAHPDVTGVYEDTQVTPYLAESRLLINQPQAINTGKRGAGTRVAVIDTGADYTNGFFSIDGKGCSAPGSGMANQVGSSTCRVLNALNFTAGSWTRPGQASHGTNVAAIAASVAPDTKIDSLQAFYVGSDGKVVGYTSDVLRAIDWVYSNATKGAYRIVSVNMSFGTTVPYSTSECSQTPYTIPFYNLRQVGVIPVSASGNEGVKTSLPEPGCVTGGVSVGAVMDVDENLSHPCDPKQPGYEAFKKDTVACKSNSNPSLTLLAPGYTVTAAGLTWDGTSQAAPHVAGAIAVLRGNNAFPSESTQYTINRLKNTGVLLRDRWSGVVTPRINLHAALLFSPEPPSLQPVQAIINQLLLFENGL